MARRFYTSGINMIVDLLVALDLRMVIVDGGYTFDVANDALEDIPVGDRIATSAAMTLSRITATNGAALDVANFSFSSVAAGSTIDAVAIYREGASDAARTLVGYIDEDSSAAAISVATNGNNVNITIPVAGLLAIVDSNAP